MNKKNIFFNTSVRTVLKIRQYCSMFQKFLAFNTPHEGVFLVFGLAFDTHDGNALMGSK